MSTLVIKDFFRGDTIPLLYTAESYTGAPIDISTDTIFVTFKDKENLSAADPGAGQYIKSTFTDPADVPEQGIAYLEIPPAVTAALIPGSKYLVDVQRVTATGQVFTDDVVNELGKPFVKVKQDASLITTAPPVTP